jgi:hypothetical protein
MIKFKFYYGNVDDFDRGPKNLVIGVKNSTTAYSVYFKPSGIELHRSHPYKPFYEIPWSISWGREKRTS